MMRHLLVLALASCASSPSIPPVRFANAPPARAVNDRLDVPHKPAEYVHERWLYNFDGQVLRPLTRTLELSRHRRALGVNALDEVPDSTWFTNRIGVRDISPEELAAAPGGVGSPEPYKPWTIVSTKVGGMTVGFIIKDARGEKFLLKFDPRGFPETETATQIIAGKLMWGFGLNVTEDYVVYLREDDLVLAPDAKIKDLYGNERPLDRAEVDRKIAQVETAPDGSIRALVSHWLPGKPIGGHSAEGVRADDPNDRIPHELRRDLRGAYALFSWLDHFDVHRGNLLDVWVTDPADSKRHYVKHYWIDYGISLGFAAKKNDEPRFGFEYYWDFGAMVSRLATFGAVERTWEERKQQRTPGIGMYEVDLYDPGAWVSSTPAYVPIYVADRIDKFWGAKIVMRFTREQIRAVVDAARLSNPRTSAWLVDALIARQRKTAQYWFERVNPIDEVAVAGDTLCFKDLSIAYAFAPARSTRYTLTLYRHDGARYAWTSVAAGDAGTSCTKIGLAEGAEGYTIVRIDTARPRFSGTTYVHLARDPTTHAPRVIGIWRP